MLPANVGVANQSQTQAKRELPLTMPQIKPGNVAASVSSNSSSNSNSSSSSSSSSKGHEQDELRYLTMANKPCNITISSLNKFNNNNSNNINNNAAAVMKTKINIVQKQLKSSSLGMGKAPVIQLVAAKPNGNANSLLSILTPKTLINGHAQPQSASTSPSPSTSSSSSQSASQPQPVLIRPTTTMTAIANGTSPGGAAILTLVAPKSTAAPKQISLVAKGAINTRTPVILSKAAVEKIRVKFNQVQAQANAGALVLTKSLKATNKNGLSITTLPSGSCNFVSKQDIAVQAAPATTTAPTSTATSLSMALPEIKITPLPAVTFNGAKVLKIQTASKLAVVMPKPSLDHEPKPSRAQDIKSSPTTGPKPSSATVPKPSPATHPKPSPATVKKPSTATDAKPSPAQQPKPSPAQGPKSIPAQEPKPIPAQKPKPSPAQEPFPTQTQDPISMQAQDLIPMQSQEPVAISTQAPIPNKGPIQITNKSSIQTPNKTSIQTPNKTSIQTPNKISIQTAIKTSIPIPTPNKTSIQTPKETAIQTATPATKQKGSPNLQRSKSLTDNDENAVGTPGSVAERRHSVAIMTKEVDVVEQIKPIETITIEDDDSEEDKKPPKAQLPATSATSTQTSRKNSSSSCSIKSSSSNSDVEMIFTPSSITTEQEQKQEQKQLSTVGTISIVKAETLQLSKEDFEQSLRCDEQVDNSPPASAVASKSKNVTSGHGTITLTPLARLQNTVVDQKSNFKRNMRLNFGMLRWREQQPSTLQNSAMRFDLNRYNLLQLTERCEPRQGPASYFERALYDRTARRPNSSTHPFLYLCSRCNCHGPASDFLAPRFCSICCVRRAHKRRQPSTSLSNGSESKMRRTQEPKLTNGQQLQQQQKQKHQKQHKQHQQHQKSHHKREREREREQERKTALTKRPFRWTEYLKTKGNGNAAPIHLFLNPFPISPNCFERGMKLEAIDPENCSLFCVCTIVEVRGYRLKLNFDGYSSMYDFWVNADSMDIFPPGWCERTSHILQAPKGHCPDRFTWFRYLMKTNAKAAPCALFTHLNVSTQASFNHFRVGMHLEAEDLNDTGKICVATVADILDERIRIHFDGWDDCYDFWVHFNSPYIHPCGWHENRQQLIVPPDYQHAAFNWATYIGEVGGIAAPAHLFDPREPMEFQAHMKLEVVDQRNPSLIRPATVVTRKGYRVQLHLDCWPAEYYFWLEDDSPDLHPIGWCEATSHELENPPGFLQRSSPMPCDLEGCRGFGNAKRFNLNVHALRDCCPYAPENWRQWRAKTVKPPRVLPENIKQTPPIKKAEPNQESTSSLLLSRLGQAKPAAVKAKSRGKAAKSRPSLEAEPKPKLQRLNHKSLAIEFSPASSASETDEVNQRCLSIAKSIVEEYGPQYKANYRLWQKNSDFDMSQLRSNPLYWTNWDVFEFVERALKCSNIAQKLFDEEIDGRALLMIGRNELNNFFKLKVGPAVKLFSLIVNLRIAVACKFDTKRTGLDITNVRQPLIKQLPSNVLTMSGEEQLENGPKIKSEHEVELSEISLKQEAAEEHEAAEKQEATEAEGDEEQEAEDAEEQEAEEDAEEQEAEEDAEEQESVDSEEQESEGSEGQEAEEHADGKKEAAAAEGKKAAEDDERQIAAEEEVAAEEQEAEEDDENGEEQEASENVEEQETDAEEDEEEQEEEAEGEADDEDDDDDDFDEDYDQTDRKEHSNQELTDDDEDVMLDSEDFLNVKPSHSIINNVATTDDKNSDVVMTALDELHASVTSVS